MTTPALIDGTGSPIGDYNSYCARGFWGKREDDATVVAHQLITFMSHITELLDADEWLLCGRDDDGRLDEPYSDQQQVERWLNARILTDDSYPPRPIPSWGFVPHIRVIRDGQRIATIDGNVGAASGGNSLTEDCTSWLTRMDLDIACAHVRAIAACWSPTFADIKSIREIMAQRNGPKGLVTGRVMIGSVTYIAGLAAADLASRMPGSVTLTDVHQGVLIVLGNGPLDYRYDDVAIVRDAVAEVRGDLRWE